MKGPLNRSVALVATSICVLAATNARAQVAGEAAREGTPSAQQSASAQPLVAEASEQSDGVQDILVTARRTAERAQSIPISISALGSSRLEALNIQTVADVSRFAPSLYVSTQPTNSASLLISIRGQAPTDTTLAQDTSVGVYVDEVYIPRSFGLAAAFADVDRVEVLKGPQGTLFGRNTTGGAVSITTRRPDLDDAGGFADLTLGTYRRGEATAAINVPVAKGVAALRVVGQVTTRDGYGVDARGRDVLAQDSALVRGGFRFEPTDRLHIYLSGDYLHFQDTGANAHVSFVNAFPATAPFATPTGLLTAVAIQAGLAPNAAAVTNANRGQARDLLAALVDRDDFYDGGTNLPQLSNIKAYGGLASIDFGISDGIQVRSITAQRWMVRSSLADVDGTPYDLLNTDFQTRAKTFSEEIQLVKNTGTGLDWILGGYYSRETGTDFTVAQSIPPVNATNPNITDASIVNKSLAAFGQVTWHLGSDFRITGGLRWTQDTRGLVTRNRTALGCNVPVALRINGSCEARLSNEYRNVSYLLSLDYRPSNALLLYAKTARGFKSGGQNFRGTIDLPSFDPFAPERVTEYEVGFKSDLLDNHLRINGAAYMSDYLNIQRTAQYLSSIGTLQNRISNAANGTIKGVELEAIATPVPGLNLSATGGLIDAHYRKFLDFIGDRTNEPFPVPKWTYTLAGAYVLQLPSGRLSFNANLTWSSSINFRGTAVNAASVTQPAYGLVNGRIQYDLEGEQVSIALFAKNILEKHYIASSFDLDRSLGLNIEYRGEPRTIGIEFKKRFGRG